MLGPWQDGAVVLVQPSTRDSAAKLAEDGIQFLEGIDKLCSFATDYLAAVGRQVVLTCWLCDAGCCCVLLKLLLVRVAWRWSQADYVDQHKLHVAGLKLRLNKLAQDWRRLEQEFSQSLAAKQAELAKLTS
jgi:hypothetical protein